jgi:hypothetical protein
MKSEAGREMTTQSGAMARQQVVALEVAGSNPVSHPTPSTTYGRTPQAGAGSGSAWGRTLAVLLMAGGLVGAAIAPAHAEGPARVAVTEPNDGPSQPVADFGVWHAKAFVLDVLEGSDPPVYRLRLIDEAVDNHRSAYRLAEAWCRDGLWADNPDDETGRIRYPAHRVQKCEAYSAN